MGDCPPHRWPGPLYGPSPQLMPLLIVITWPDSELPPPVMRIIERLEVEPIARGLVLNGLDEPAMNALLTQIGQGGRASCVQWVCDVTGANPRAAIDLVERLRRTGRVGDPGRTVGDPASGGSSRPSLRARGRLATADGGTVSAGRRVATVDRAFRRWRYRARDRPRPRRGRW